MSLINDMLKDLESRERGQDRQRAPAASQYPSEARLASPSWASPSLLFQSALVCLVVGVAVGWMVRQQGATPDRAALPERAAPRPVQGVATAVDTAELGQAATDFAAATGTPSVASPSELPPSERSTMASASGVEGPLPERPLAAAAATRPLPLRATTSVSPSVAAVSSPPSKASPTPAPVRTTSANVPGSETRAIQAATAVRPVAETPPSSTVKSRVAAGDNVNGSGTGHVPAKDMLALKAEQKFQQALNEHKQGAQEPALSLLRESLDLNPQHAQARLALARLLVERKQSAAAADVLGDGLMLSPQQTLYMLALAPLWIQAGQQEDAMTLLAQGLKSASGDPQFHAYYASQLLRLKRHADAEMHYRIALRGDPSKADWMVGLGLSLQAMGNTRETIEVMRRASESGQLSKTSKDLVDQVIAKLQSQAP